MTTPTRSRRRSQEWSGASPTLLDVQDGSPSKGSTPTRDSSNSTNSIHRALKVGSKKGSTGRIAEQAALGAKAAPHQVEFEEHRAVSHAQESMLGNDNSVASSVDLSSANHEEACAVAAAKNAVRKSKTSTKLKSVQLQARIMALESEIQGFKPPQSSHKTTGNLNEAKKTIHKSSSGKISKRKSNVVSLSTLSTEYDQRIAALQAKVKANEERMERTALDFDKCAFGDTLKTPLEPLAIANRILKPSRDPLLADRALAEQAMLTKREIKSKASETPLEIESKNLQNGKTEKSEEAEMNLAVAAWLLAHSATNYMEASKEIKLKSLNLAIEAGLSHSPSPQKSASKRTMIIPANIPGPILAVLELDTKTFAATLFNSLTITAKGDRVAMDIVPTED